jgi:hypothetical protein
VTGLDQNLALEGCRYSGAIFRHQESLSASGKIPNPWSPGTRHREDAIIAANQCREDLLDEGAVATGAILLLPWIFNARTLFPLEALMKCPHCTVEFHPDTKKGQLPLPSVIANQTQWNFKTTACPACEQAVVYLSDYNFKKGRGSVVVAAEFMAYPRAHTRGPTPNDVPAHIREDYEEACAVLPHSAKASAALARR